MKKHILILGHSYGTPFIESVNQYAALFASGEYSVTVAYLSGKPCDKVISTTLHDEIIFFNFVAKDLRGLKLTALKKLYALCQRKKFHIIIGHRYKALYFLLLLNALCRIPHIFVVTHAMHTFKSKARALLVRLFFKKNLVFVGVSNAVCANINKDLPFLPASQFLTLYNLINTEDLQRNLFSRKVARYKLKLLPEDFIFCNIARHVDDKDQLTLIHAFAQIVTFLPQAKLVLIGSGKMHLQLKATVLQLCLTHQVIFTGELPGAVNFLNAFDVFCLSSKEEAFGRVLIEAMAAKIPIVATDCDGIPEVVGDLPLVEVGNVPAYAAAMLACARLTSIEKAQLINKSFTRVKSLFSFEKFQETFFNSSSVNSQGSS